MRRDNIVDEEYDLMPPEFMDFYAILEEGAKKYAPHDWENGNGAACETSRRNFESIFRHVSAAAVNPYSVDESGYSHLLHAVTRLLMEYTLVKRNIRPRN